MNGSVKNCRENNNYESEGEGGRESIGTDRASVLTWPSETICFGRLEEPKQGRRHLMITD